MKYRDKIKKDTELHIRRTAYELFEKKGYEQTTMRELAKQAGIGLGTIFNYYPDKSSLLAAAFTDDLGHILNRTFTKIPELPVIEQLSYIVKNIYSFYARHHLLSRILVKELLFIQGSQTNELENQLNGFMKYIEGIFIKSIERREIKSNLDINDAVLAFASFYFLGLHSGLKGSSFKISFQVKTFQRLLSQYLSCYHIKGCEHGRRK